MPLPENKLAEVRGVLGLAARAGAVVYGTDLTRRAIRRGALGIVLLADDAAGPQAQKVERIARARGIPVARFPERADLGEALGKGRLTAVGVRKGPFADTLRDRLEDNVDT